jgi:hypothetical protein
MLIFDDRFARQNRCEPPPEFPLASPYTSIVHHLSGPKLYALTQIHPNTSGSVDDAPKLSPAFTFITRAGFTPKHSRKTSTPWSVFQDGSLMTITPASLQSANLGLLRGIIPWVITLPEEPHSQGFYPPMKTDAGLSPEECTSENAG